jgi:hypothetical protein
MIRLAVFDLDGTLVDSRRDLATAANALVRELGGTPLNEEAVGDMVGEGAGVLVRRALAAAGLAADAPGALDRFLSLYDAHLLDTTAPYEGIDELLHGLAGRVAIAVLTNKPQHASERMLDGLGLLAHYEAWPEARPGGPAPPRRALRRRRRRDPAGRRLSHRPRDRAPGRHADLSRQLRVRLPPGRPPGGRTRRGFATRRRQPILTLRGT